MTAKRRTTPLAEYERAPGVTRERLYIETIETVLASSKKVLLDTDGKGSLIYLPLDKLLDQTRRAPRPRLSAARSARRIWPEGKTPPNCCQWHKPYLPL